MVPSSILTRCEEPDDAARVEALQRAAFGPGAYARAAFRVREKAAHDLALSFLTEEDGALIASVRMTPVSIGSFAGFLLGPLVVEPAKKGLGHGRALVRKAVKAAAASGTFVILVGDEPYYGPLGFKPLPPGRVRMPGPVDPARLLAAELSPGTIAMLQGPVRAGL